MGDVIVGKVVTRLDAVPPVLLAAAIATLDDLDGAWHVREAGDGWSGVALVAPGGDVGAVDYVDNAIRGDWAATFILDSVPALGDLIGWVGGLGCGRVGHSRLLALSPRGSVGWHSDNLPDGVSRVHVPLVSARSAELIDAGGRRHHLAVGWAWLVDTSGPHMIRYRAKLPAPARVHLVVDCEG